MRVQSSIINSISISMTADVASVSLIQVLWGPVWCHFYKSPWCNRICWDDLHHELGRDWGDNITCLKAKTNSKQASLSGARVGADWGSGSLVFCDWRCWELLEAFRGSFWLVWTVVVRVVVWELEEKILRSCHREQKQFEGAGLHQLFQDWG